MKTLKHLLTALLLMVATVAMAHDFEVGGIYYSILSEEEKTVEVTYRGNSYSSYSNEYTGSVDIPSMVTYNDLTYSVTSIGGYAFYGCSGLTSVTIGNGVTSIGVSAFSGCSGLTNVTIGNGVTSIRVSAFKGTAWYNNLSDGVVYAGKVLYTYKGTMPENTNISIKEGTLGIADEAFSGCSGLASITIPSSVTSIGEYAFMECSGLTSIEIPNNVTSIGDYAFMYCIGLTNVTIPNSVTSIGNGVFGVCASLTSVTIPNSVTSIGDNAFMECLSLSTIEIPNSVTAIGNEVFMYCGNLHNVTIGSGVKNIGYGAFYDCYCISKIVSRAKMPPLCDLDVFNNIDNLECVLWVPEGSKQKYQVAEQWKDFVNIEEFNIEIYKVTFIVDGEVYDTLSVECGEKITLPETPVKEGHTFSGWSEVPETMPAEDITITGSFEVNTYAVTYIVDGEVYATDSIAYGSEIVLRDEPAKEGHTFSGWSEVPETMPANDITIEGTFSINSYTVTFMIDGEVYETATVEFGAEIELPTPPEKEGYIFSGWVGVPDTMPAEDIVIEGEYIVDTTGINDVKAENGKVKGVYDLQGRKVDNATNGIYIINGKKTLIK